MTANDSHDFYTYQNAEFPEYEWPEEPMSALEVAESLADWRTLALYSTPAIPNVQKGYVLSLDAEHIADIAEVSHVLASDRTDLSNAYAGV
jgi:hypothetical protein